MAAKKSKKIAVQRETSLANVGNQIAITNKILKSIKDVQLPDFGTFTDPRDGNVYRTVKIGGQVWMAENLRYLPYVCPVEVHGGIWFYDNIDNDVMHIKDTNNYKKFGCLYDWETSLSVCPEGWHLPSEEEWASLVDFLGGGSIALTKLKTLSDKGNQNFEITNSSGFSAIPGGSRSCGFNPKFGGIGSHCEFWTSTEEKFDWSCAKVCVIHRNSSELAVSYCKKAAGLSVRFVKDEYILKNPLLIQEKNLIKVRNSEPIDLITNTPSNENLIFEFSQFKDLRDGNEYKTVRIGEQEWMAENLRFIPHISPCAKEGGIWVYDYNGYEIREAKVSRNYKKFGCLYNWEIAKANCPSGWHLPSDEEWKTLEIYLGMNIIQSDEMNNRGYNQGSLLKSKNGWKNEGNGLNSIGFEALPGGCRDEKYFNLIDYSGYWWSSSKFDLFYAWRRCIRVNYTSIDRHIGHTNSGYSVRCIRDL
jgi:uncharacterized protein (TIGR02145 family)